MKKLICFILALTLIGGAALGEGTFGKLFDAAVELAFDTHNVSLSAKATFTYDGELFKVMDAKYQQDGIRSFLSYMLDTPAMDGEMSTSGYIVLGLGDKSFAGDTIHKYWYENPTKISDTVLSTNNRTQAQLQVARLLALAAEELTQSTQNGNTYTFTAGRLPALISSGAYYLAVDYVQDNYYLDLFNLYTYDYTNSVSVFNEDWEGLVRAQYQNIYGGEMPSVDEIYADDTLYGRYSVAINAANQLEAEAAAGYDKGVVYIKKDGSVQWYESEEEYMRGTGKVDLFFASWKDAFKNYYKLACGAEISDETLEYVIYSPNQALWEAYTAFNDEMIDYYGKLAISQDPKALRAIVMPDGSIKTYDYKLRDGETLTQHILYSMTFAELKSLEATVETDDAGRLSAFKGTVEIELTDNQAKLHTLKIEFDCKAEDYGTTSVPDVFEPTKYNLISYEDYIKAIEDVEEDYSGGDEWEALLKNDPLTIEFAGKTYETMLDELMP